MADVTKTRVTETLTALVLTYNEKENIGRTLEHLQWLPQVLLLDSFSNDGTCDIARRFANVRIEQRDFDTHSSQWNHGLSLVTTEWILALDADYIVPDEFRAEVDGLGPPESAGGYSACFHFVLAGRALRSSLYPPRVVLFKVSRGRYVDEGHTQKLEVSGTVTNLRTALIHDDRKPLRRWLISQDRYAVLEARHLLVADRALLGKQDRLRLKGFLAPPVMFVYLLFVRGLILDGWRGWFYVMQRVIAECLLSLRLLIEKNKLENVAQPPTAAR